MTTPDDGRPGRPTRQRSHSVEDRQGRQRRAPLFPLVDDDLASYERRGPPSPLGDLLDDIDRAIPSKAEPARQVSPRREDEALLGQAGRSDQVSRPTPAPLPPLMTTRERPVAARAQMRSAQLKEFVEAQTVPLRRARAGLDEAAADLLRLEHDLAVGGRPGLGGYLTPALPDKGLSQRAWVVMIALVSVLILVILGGGGGEAGFSRWSKILDGGNATDQSRLALFAAQVRPVGDYTLRAPPSISPETIDSILASYGSPAAGTGAIWYNLGREYGIDPAFAIAFFVHESAAGTAQAWAGLKPDGSSTHNVGNIICAGYSTCYGRFRDYPSWAEGIEDWYRLIDVEYLNGRGHQTVADIIPVYAPSIENDVQGYINVVQNLVDQWRTQGAP